MENNEQKLIDIAKKVVEKYKIYVKQYFERMYEGYSKRNNNVSPTIDINGRLHSPHDGYLFESETYYNKGEFLPEQDCFADEFFQLSGIKVDPKESAVKLKISSLMKDELNKINELKSNTLAISFGNEWINKEGNKECYAYISGSCAKSFINEIREQIELTRNKDNEEAKNKKGKLEEGLELQLVGEIISHHYVENSFLSTHYNTVYDRKITIMLENGSTIYGSMPKKIKDSVENDYNELIGKKMKFVANITKSKNDETHGYYKNPKKIEIFNKEMEIKDVPTVATRKIKIK